MCKGDLARKGGTRLRELRVPLGFFFSVLTMQREQDIRPKDRVRRVYDFNLSLEDKNHES